MFFDIRGVFIMKMKKLLTLFVACSCLLFCNDSFAKERRMDILIGANEEDIVHMLGLLEMKQTSRFVDESLSNFCKKMTENSGYKFFVDADISERKLNVFSDNKSFSDLLSNVVKTTNSYVLVKDGYYLISEVGLFIGRFDRAITKEDLIILSDMLYKGKSELKVGSRDFEISLHRNDMRNFINVLKRLNITVELTGTNVLFPVIEGFH